MFKKLMDTAATAATTVVAKTHEALPDAIKEKVDSVIESKIMVGPCLPATAKLNIVTEECKRQVDDIIAECRSSGSKYTDTNWAYDSMLNADMDNPLSEEWMQYPTHYVRLQHMCKDPVLFDREVRPGDIVQGGLGTCFLMGAINVVGLSGSLLQTIFVRHDVQCGVYGVVLYINGDWTFVIIDDFLPAGKCKTEEGYYPIFAENKNRHEMWAPLLEKAYAKCYSAYSHLDGGMLRYAMMDLTGGVASKVPIEAGSEFQVRPLAVWCTGIETHADSTLDGRLSGKGGAGVSRPATKRDDSTVWPVASYLKEEAIRCPPHLKSRTLGRMEKGDVLFYTKTMDGVRGHDAWWPLSAEDVVGVYVYVSFQDGWELDGGGVDRIRRGDQMIEANFTISGTFSADQKFEFEKTYTGAMGAEVAAARYRGAFTLVKGGAGPDAGVVGAGKEAFDSFVKLVTGPGAIGGTLPRDSLQLVGTFDFEWKKPGNGRVNTKDATFRLISLFNPPHMPVEPLPDMLTRLLTGEKAKKFSEQAKRAISGAIAANGGKPENILAVAIEDPDAEAEAPCQDGLLKNHAYGVTGFFTDAAGHQLVRLQNPHGNTQWNGDYCATSDKWTADLKKVVSDYAAADEGTFYMTVDDFLSKWNTLEICRLISPKFNMASFELAFAPGLCGGREKWWMNPQFLLSVTQPTELLVVLQQANTKVFTGEDDYDIGLGLLGVQHPSMVTALSGQDVREVFEAGPAYDRQLTVTVTVTPSDTSTFHLIPFTMEYDVSLPVSLTIFSDRPFSAARIGAEFVCSGCSLPIHTGFHCEECYEVSLCDSCHVLTTAWAAAKKIYPLKTIPDTTPKPLVELGHSRAHRVSRILGEAVRCLSCDVVLSGYGAIDISEGKSDNYCWECAGKEMKKMGLEQMGKTTGTQWIVRDILPLSSKIKPGTPKLLDTIVNLKSVSYHINPFQACVFGFTCTACGAYSPIGEADICVSCYNYGICCKHPRMGNTVFHMGHTFGLVSRFKQLTGRLTDDARTTIRLLCIGDEARAGDGNEDVVPPPPADGVADAPPSEDSEEDEGEEDEGAAGGAAEGDASNVTVFCSKKHPMALVEPAKDWKCAACEVTSTEEAAYYSCETCTETLCTSCEAEAAIASADGKTVDLSAHAVRVRAALEDTADFIAQWFEDVRPAVLEQVLYGMLLEETPWTVRRDEQGRIFFHNEDTKVSQWDPPPELVAALGEEEMTMDLEKGSTLRLNGHNVLVRGRNVKARGRNVKARGRTVKARGRNVKARGRNVKARGRNVKARGRAVKARGRNVKARGRMVKARGRMVKARGRTVKARGRAVKARGRSTKARTANFKVRGACKRTDDSQRGTLPTDQIEAVPAHRTTKGGKAAQSATAGTAAVDAKMMEEEKKKEEEEARRKKEDEAKEKERQKSGEEARKKKEEEEQKAGEKKKEENKKKEEEKKKKEDEKAKEKDQRKEPVKKAAVEEKKNQADAKKKEETPTVKQGKKKNSKVCAVQ